MKKLFTLSVFCLILAVNGFSQSKTYVTSGLEMIFSFANIKDNGQSENSTLRWAPVLNIQSYINADLSQHFGIFSGLAVRNVGYIYDNYKTVLPEGGSPIKKKFRSYNIGIPVGLKLGNLEKMFLYGGYEVEFPFLYKEKTFDASGDKTNTTKGWFSSKEEWLQHGFFVGIQFPYGLNLKFKYYLSEFHNQDYTENGVQPYKGLQSNIFYFSLCANLFRDNHFDVAH
jgi:hypothetical protein